MFRLSKWTRRALFVGLGACAVLFAGAYPGGGEASPLRAATAPPLGTAASFAVLAGSGITNTGASVIDGDIGSYPTTTITGFPPGTVGGTNHGGDSVTQGAKTDLTTAYNNAAGQTPASTVPTELGGTTLTPGVYKSAAGTFGITGTLTLNGNASAVWIFQMASTLTTGSGSRVVLTGGASPCNVFWQVGSSATLGTNSTFVGNILAYTSITLTTGATVSGRALARNGAVTLDTNTVNASVCGAPTATAVPTAATATRTASAVPATATSAPSGSSSGNQSAPGPTQVAAQTQIAAATAQAAATSVPASVPTSAATSVPASVPTSAATSSPAPAPILTPTPATPRALPNTGDASSPGYGWWMVAGLILSIGGFFFLRAGQRP